ncbi:MAG: cobyrinate a,c-diamide synthase [Burkholderiaceae bacterium]
MSRFLVSAAHKSSGKTTVSIGLCAALRARGLAVQPFKKGPDFIDPMWLSAAAGRACRNLDPYLSPAADLRDSLALHGRDADVCVVEGNIGLHDGMSADGRDSSAGLAKALGLPVVLVLDTRGMTRGVAPLLIGYRTFDTDLRIAGVILNRVGGARHEAKLRAAIAQSTDMAVLGVLHEAPSHQIVERHLGLVPSSESTEAHERIEGLGAFVAAGVDLDRLLALTHTGADEAGTHSPVCAEPQSPKPAGHRESASVAVIAPAETPVDEAVPWPDSRGASAVIAHSPTTTPLPASSRRPDGAPRPIRVAIARNEAFGFYYPDDLEAFVAAGATLVAFDPLRDASLPEVEALFIGGGFPEVMANALSENRRLREDIRRRLAEGLPAYAECGGLMYLARSLQWGTSRVEMVGAIPGDVIMHERPVGRGYVHLEETADSPWPGRWHGTIRAHEFHYSSLGNLPADARYAYRVTRGHGIDGDRDGLVIGNLLASYTHLRSLPGRDWPARFVAFARAACVHSEDSHAGHTHR